LPRSTDSMAEPQIAPPLDPNQTPAPSQRRADLGKLLAVMRKIGASDLHLKEGGRPLYRIHGELREAEHPPLTREECLRFVDESLPKHHHGEWEKHGSADYAMSIDVLTRFRVNVFKSTGKIAFAFRILELEAKTFEQLHLPEVCYTIAQARRGMVLVTGPTGSGKTTTLAAYINHINENRREHIITIEDPIEYIYFDKMSRIDQRELGSDTTTFDNALRGALRQDPDVILVGEMADLATALNAIMCQRLVPRPGGGRVAGVEVLVVTELIGKLIREDRINDVETVMRTAQEGMQTFDAALAALVRKELITLETGILYADDQPAFKRMAKGTTAGADTAGLIGAF
jgi:twitching motility protein PilT